MARSNECDDGDGDRFSVCEFLADGTWTRVASGLCARDAVARARRATEAIEQGRSSRVRVMIEDAGGCCVFDWMRGTGVVFPPHIQDGGTTRH